MQSGYLQTVGQVGRRLRNPQHTFALRHAPYEIQPFLIAPVLPGETMKNLSLQARVQTRPIKNSLVGWWCEHYVFYVKHRDLHDPTKFTDLMINSSAVLSAHEDWKTGVTDLFYGWRALGTGMDWTKACLRVVIENFFRDEGEAYDVTTIDAHPAAYLTGNTPWDSAILDTSMATATEVNIPVDAAPTPDIVKVSDVIRAMETYQMLVNQNLVNQTYEDWLRSYGVRTQAAVVNKPELIRFMREWTYPSAFVQPDTGGGDSDVTASCSWSIAERADKDRFFAEPGFIFGVTVVRPKVYFANQSRPLASLLDDAKSWLPAVLRGDNMASWKKITDAASDPLSGVGTGDWWIDLKDLFVYGDQFTNLPNTVADFNHMGLPSTTANPRYPVQAGVDALFVSADATDGVVQDGIVRLSILGNIEDTSPRGTVFGGPAA